MAIVGLGGTGSYILDYVAKTPVKEIHLFDGDEFLNHNAFRAPGQNDEELRSKLKKVHYLQSRYVTMRRGIVPHDFFITAETVEHLRGMDFASSRWMAAPTRNWRFNDCWDGRCPLSTSAWDWH